MAPVPRSTAAGSGADALAAADAFEGAVRRAFARILGAPEPTVTVASDFFLLGGTSILGAQLVAVLRQELPVTVTIRDLFRARTAGNLASCLRTRAGA